MRAHKATLTVMGEHQGEKLIGGYIVLEKVTPNAVGIAIHDLLCDACRLWFDRPITIAQMRNLEVIVKPEEGSANYTAGIKFISPPGLKLDKND